MWPCHGQSMCDRTRIYHIAHLTNILYVKLRSTFVARITLNTIATDVGSALDEMLLPLKPGRGGPLKSWCSMSA